MINRAFSSLNSFFKVINSTIHIYPILIGIFILYLSYYSGIGQYGMGFAFVFGSIFDYILIKGSNTKKSSRTNSTPRNYQLFIIINIIYWISFSISLIILHSVIYVRPILYFILVTISFCSIFLEIFQIKSDTYSYILVLKIILVSLSLRIGRFFNYPSIPGSDTHFHLNLAELIIQNGFISSYSIADKYSYSCLWHILNSICGIILDVNMRNMLFYSIVLSSTIITSLFVYCIVKKIYNYQIAVISVLLINISDMVFVQNVTNINPSSIVYCFFLVILFCIIHENKKYMHSAIAILMIFCMILSHQLSTFCVLLILVTLLLSKFSYYSYHARFINNNFNLNDLELNLYLNTILLYIVSLILQWSTIGSSVNGYHSFFDSMISRLFGTLKSTFTEYAKTTNVPTTQYEQLFSGFNFYSNLFYNLGSNILLMFAIVGILITLRSKSKYLLKFSYICATFMLIGLVYAGTYIGLGYLLVPHRFLPFLQYFYVVFASVSMYKIVTINYNKWIKFGLITLLIFLIFFIITTPYLNRGDAIYSKDMIYRDQYTFSELKSLEWSSNYLKDQNLSVDSIIYPRPLTTVQNINITINQLQNFNPMYPVYPNNIFVRQYIVENPDLMIGGTFGKTHEFNYNKLIITISQNYNLIYSTNSGNIYQM